MQPATRAAITPGTTQCVEGTISAPKWGSKAAKIEQGAGEARSQGLLPAGLGGGHGSWKELPAPHGHHEKEGWAPREGRSGTTRRKVGHQPPAPHMKGGKSRCLQEYFSAANGNLAPGFSLQSYRSKIYGPL